MEKENRTKLARMIQTANAHHTTTGEAARIAEQARVKMLVLGHVRHAPNLLADWLFMREVRKVFHGKAAIAEDGMEKYFPPTDG